MRLQRVTKGYRGLKGVTKGTGDFSGLQVVTWGNKGLQGVTRGTFKSFH